MASQLVKVKVTTGKYKNEIFLVENNLSGNRAFDIVVEKGSNVILSIQETPEGVPNVYIADFVRDTYLYIILALFAILLIVIGKMKGLKSLITLSVTAFVVLKVMLPLFLKGYNPIWVTVLSAFFITVITFVIIGGLNIKSISAIIGTLGGVLIAGTLAYVIGKTARLTGLSSEEAHMLMFIPQNIDFNFQGLLFAGIIIGALGAVMDVAMSVASSMFEIREINPDISPTELMKSGMNVGKDIMGTMSNTLILAYTGSSIPLILVFMAYEASLVKILNLDLMATEIIRSIVGSIGLIITIPITSLATGLILKYKDSL
ncbi:MAG: YibE/F family protein [Firmicutes bacterium]|nr:YibE/F family protein [Bacillota bacterium]